MPFAESLELPANRSGALSSPARPDAAAVAAGAVVLIGCLSMAWAARHSTFTADEWSFILQLRGFSAHVILSPFNGHLIALPLLAFKALLAIFGLSSYAPFITLMIVLHGVASLLLYALARRYLGPWLGLIPVAIFVTLGPAWHALLVFASINVVAGVAPGLGMMVCLERRDRSGDIGAGALLGVSLLCSSLGAAMAVFAVVLIVLQRPTAWRRLWAVAVPVALYLLWYSHYGVNTARTSNIPHIPRYVFDAASAAAASVTGLAQTHLSPYLVSPTYGHIVVVVAVGLFGFALARGFRPPPLTWAALATMLALWTVEALEYFPNGREAAQSRYQYVGGLLVLLAASSALSGWRPGRRLGAALAVATVAICASNLAILHSRAFFWAMNSSYDRSETGALQVARGIVAPDFAPENRFNIPLMGDHNLTVVTAAPYFSAIDTWGSSAYPAQRILDQDETVRESADLVLASAERLGPFILGTADRLVPLLRSGAISGTCRPAVTRSMANQFTAEPGAAVVIATGGRTVELGLRRLASSYKYVHWSIGPKATVILRTPRDHAALPWHVLVFGGATVRLCTG